MKPSPRQWVDAAWYELIRIATLGITGFDTPGSLEGLPESATALSSVKMILLSLKKTENSLNASIDRAIEQLQSAKDFDSFDRASFLRHYWQPVFATVAETREKEGVLMNRMAVSGKARSLFGDNFLNVAFFAHDNTPKNGSIIALGKALFSDKRLSSKGTFSCASCHQPANFFADQNALSTNIHGKLLARNTPSLLNAAFQTHFFWDMRVNTLEMQVKSVIENSDEMDGNIESVVQRLNADMELVSLFNSAFEKKAGDSIKQEQITHVLAAYQRTLTGFNSSFDDYMNGNDTAIQPAAIKGFNLFMGKAKCGTCHFAPVFSGLVPPFYDKMESEVIGVPADSMNNQADKDNGRFSVYPFETFRFAFKTPSVRNTANTFPYMHNGVYQTLEQVVDFYNKGGGAGLGLNFPNQTLSSNTLNLSVIEQKQLVAFMKTLDSKIRN
jgi:cytochrome c peroxidase